MTQALLAGEPSVQGALPDRCAAAAGAEVGQSPRVRKILAVSSGGGHWVQLLRLMPAFERHDVAYVTVNRAYEQQVKGARFHLVNDVTRWNKFGLLLASVRMLTIIARERPDVVISTGAAPGYLAIRIARLLGVATVWVDSIANVERVSMSGQRAGRVAELWLTQWPHLERPDGPRFAGAVV